MKENRRIRKKTLSIIENLKIQTGDLSAKLSQQKIARENLGEKGQEKKSCGTIKKVGVKRAQRGYKKQ
jgi:hypothetical protein